MSSAGFRHRWPTASRTACSAAVAALLLAGCGGGEQPNQAAAPKLPADVGAALADDAANVGAALDAGDDAAAQAAAEALVADVDAAIAAGDVPAGLRAELAAGVAQLLVALPDVQPAKPGKGKGRDKKDEHNGDED